MSAPEKVTEGVTEVVTVCGAVAAAELGRVLPHEHLSSDSSIQADRLHEAPDEALLALRIDPADRDEMLRPLAMDSLGWVRRHVFNVENLRLKDEDAVVESLVDFRHAGGGTVIECTTQGIHRDPESLRRLSERSGVHVVMGCGRYLTDLLPADAVDADVEEVADRILLDLTEGADDTGIRAGIIGEIGTGWPIAPAEETSLRAAALASARTGAGIQVHPGRHPDAPAALLRILEDAGADLSRVSLSHLDRTFRSAEQVIEIARRGCFVEFDMFGQESSYYAYGDVDLPNDATRVAMLREVADAGLVDTLLISHDLGYRSLLPRYGGPGYAHLLRDVLPLMLRRGFDRSEVDTITIANPARLLTGDARVRVGGDS